MRHESPPRTDYGLPMNRWTADNHLPFDEDEYGSSVIARWHRVVSHLATHPAIVTDDQTLSYQQVDQQAAQIAHRLLAAERPSPLIALLFTHDSNPIIALLGVLKADFAYVALNATLPQQQLHAQLADSRAAIIVTDQAHLAIAKEIATQGQQIINVDRLNDSSVDISGDISLPKAQKRGDALLCVLFTSGSSGAPKGVMLPQNHILQIARRSACCYHTHFADRVALLYEWSYAMGTVVTFSTLLNGATLYFSDAVKQNRISIPQWVAAQQITILNLPIPLFRYLAQDSAIPAVEMGEQLAIISVGGMKLSWADVANFVTRYGCSTVQIEFGYGMTEAGWVSNHWLPLTSLMDKAANNEADSILAGVAALDKELLILDEQGQPLPTNHVGEVAVRSHTMALGYWQQPEQTAERFGRDATGQRIYLSGDIGRVHMDGQLEILGRKDAMVKVRGYRIELSSIELALRQLDFVTEAAVIAPEQADGDRRLIAYLVTSESRPTQQAIRSCLRDRLAEHEIPSQFVFLASLPLTISGKLDRNALPVPASTRSHTTDYVEPRFPIEANLVTLWTELLDVAPIGIRDNFFELGGHSLHVMTLMTKLEAEFGTRPNLTYFFTMPTVEHLAQLLSREMPQQPTALTFTSFGLSATQANALQELSVQLSDGTQPQKWQKVNSSDHWHRRRKTIHWMAQSLPQRLRYRLLRQLAHSRAWRRLYFGKEVMLTERFFALLDREQGLKIHQRADETLARSLLCNWIHHYQIAPRQSRARQGGEMAEQQLTAKHIEGMAYLEAAKARGQGIILVGFHETHFQQDLPALRPTITVGGLQHYLAHFKIDNQTIANSLFSQHLNSARQSLQEKGMVLVIPDGHHGYSEGRYRNFYGRHRPFRSSFAELALLTGATVIAMMREIDEEGRAQIKLTEPLDAGDNTMSHADRIEQLVDQYIALLSKMWSETPWLVPWYQMKRHLAYPPASHANGTRV